MLTENEEMKYFLCKAYGDSKNFDVSTINLKLQVLCQSNGAAPSGRSVIIITIVCVHKRKLHGGHCMCTIYNLTGDLSALLFVDNTDLIHINIKAEENVTVTHQAMKYSISNWGQLRIASGGALKPPK